MEVEGNRQVIDVDMAAAVVVAVVEEEVLVGADLVSHVILNFEVCLLEDSFFYKKGKGT